MLNTKMKNKIIDYFRKNNIITIEDGEEVSIDGIIKRFTEEQEENKYKRAYHLLMMYYDSIADEEKEFIDKELKKLGL